jgi:hypothetical protein
MGGIVSLSKKKREPSDYPATRVESHVMINFYSNNSKVLASQQRKSHHPHLVMLRMILGCEYGRPKLMQYLMRTTPIQEFFQYEDENNWNGPGDNSFIADHFISRFKLLDPAFSCIPEQHQFDNSSLISEHALTSFLPYFILIAATSNYQSFLRSSEHSDWLKYQNLVLNSRNSASVSQNNVMKSDYSPSAMDQIAMEINHPDYTMLFHQSHWIVALAHLFEEIPFPVTILGLRDPELIPQTNSSIFQPSPTSQAKQQIESPIILFGNNAFVQMIGYSREEISQHPYNKYHSHLHSNSSVSCTEPEAALSIDFGKTSRIGMMYHPQPPLHPFLNLLSCLPLLDLDGVCHYMLVVHCDIWKHHQDSEYLHKLDIFTETVSHVILPRREHEKTCLQAYFYERHQHEQEVAKLAPLSQ